MRDRDGAVTEESLTSLLVEWQRRLRLQDWDIHVRVVRAREIEDGCQAQVTWQLAKRMAVISLIDPIDYPSDTPWPCDVEQSLVHELLHLHFAPFDDHPKDSLEHTCMEQAIHAIAQALVQAKQGEEATANA